MYLVNWRTVKIIDVIRVCLSHKDNTKLLPLFVNIKNYVQLKLIKNISKLQKSREIGDRQTN